MRPAVHKGPNNLNIYPEEGFSKALRELVLISRALPLPTQEWGWGGQYGWAGASMASKSVSLFSASLPFSLLRLGPHAFPRVLGLPQKTHLLPQSALT